MADAPTVDAVRAARARLGNLVETTPVRRLSSPLVERRLGKTEVILKEELFQRTGSFKPRGALCVMLDLPAEARDEVVSSEAFGHYVAEIWHDLREEASRGIRDDEARMLEQRAKR